MSNVLVIFQANTERTEQLALAVAVGAVESEASIRLRRLVTTGSVEVGHKGYGTLKESDLLWADTIVVGLEDSHRSEELDGLLSALNGVEKAKFNQKHAWTFGPEGTSATKTEAHSYVEGAFRKAGVTLWTGMPDAVEMTEFMKETGRLLAKKA
jgi:hypothetical protein